MSKKTILVCDDESVARRGIVRALGSSRYELIECGNGAECLEVLATRSVDLVLLDLRMPVMDGQTTLAEIGRLPAPPTVVVLTADASLESAVAAIKQGAYDFVTKPYDIGALRHAVDKALEQRHLKRENRALVEEVERLGGPRTIVGESERIRELLGAIERVAPSRASVLIRGESGTGKELVARRIHEISDVADGPFVTVNCSAIPENLVESELFGHRKGAFTGADRDRAGKFRDADGGTLFLDEIGDMALAAQAKLLRVLEEGEVEPVGGSGAVSVRVRVVAATHRDLDRLVADERFREDLLFRLRVVELEVPPLRDRGDDIVPLARHFLSAFADGGLELSNDAEHLLTRYSWPGNIRELRNAIERASIFCRDGIVRPEDLPREVSNPGATAPVSRWDPADDFQTAKQKAIDRFEREILSSALEEHRGNISRAARALGIHRQNLQQKLRQLNLSAERFRR